MFHGILNEPSLNEAAKKAASRALLTNTHGPTAKKVASTLSADCSMSSSSSSSSSSTKSTLSYMNYANKKNEANTRRYHDTYDDDKDDDENIYDESNTSKPHSLLLYNPYYESIQLPTLKCSPYFESPINNSQIQYDCAAPIARNTPENNEVKLIDYREHKMASFKVDGKVLICLPQAFEVFLKSLVGGLHTVYTKLKRLEIVPIICNVEQV